MRDNSQKDFDMKTTEHEKTVMEFEIERVSILLSEAIAQIDGEGGSLRYFNAALMSAAMVLHAQVEGPETLDAAMTKNAKALMVKSGGAGTC